MTLFYSVEISLFFNIIPEYIDKFVPSCYEFKQCRGRNRALAFAANHEQPFPLHYCGIGDLTSVASEAQINGGPDEEK
jgi:hypothetical protein